LDAFAADGGVEAAEMLFNNKGKPVDCMSARCSGVNYRVSMLIGFAGRTTKFHKYVTMYNPNFWNQFKRDGETDEDVRGRSDGLRLLTFMRALEHTKRTGGKFVLPVQIGRKDGRYSGIQKAEKLMAEEKGIPVIEFEYEEGEVSEMATDGEIKVERDETAFLKRLEAFLVANDLA